jgi:hypothetical protein
MDNYLISLISVEDTGEEASQMICRFWVALPVPGDVIVFFA